VFHSETDTEVIGHLLEEYLKHNGDPTDALLRTLKELKGAFALGILIESFPDRLFAARRGSPLIIGVGHREVHLASDVLAIAPHTHTFLDINDDEIAVMTADSVKLLNANGEAVTRPTRKLKLDTESASKNGYPHFMLKEIHQQPKVLEGIINRYVGPDGVTDFGSLGLENSYLARISRVIIQACGTSWHAGLIGKLLLENFAHVATDVDISSEFRYRNPILEGDTLVIAISQSGETADTLAGLRQARSRFLKVLAICNTPTSAIAHEADAFVDMLAGPEVGVASTKAYTAELAVIALLAAHIGRVKWTLSKEDHVACINKLREAVSRMDEALEASESIKDIAGGFAERDHCLFLGRSYNMPTALEGALKLKEISYIHATGYPAGEFKHGPIALISERMPVVGIAPKGTVYEKMVSNLMEVKARQGNVIAVGNPGSTELFETADHVITVPEVDECFSPLLTVVPLQLLAYHVAVLRGCDVDQPRNLAKSVTVE